MLRKLLAGAAIVALVSPALAAVTPNSIVTAQGFNTASHTVQFLNADSAGTYKIVYTGQTNGSKCNAIWLITNDTATHVVQFQFATQTTVISGITGGRGGPAITTTAAGALTAYAAPINVLASWTGLPTGTDGNPYLQVTSSDSIQVTFATTVTSGAAISVVASCVDL